MAKDRAHPRRRGQAVVEYILMMSMAVGVVAILGTTFRRTLVKLWTTFAVEIAAGCPDVPNCKRPDL